MDTGMKIVVAKSQRLKNGIKSAGRKSDGKKSEVRTFFAKKKPGG